MLDKLFTRIKEYIDNHTATKDRPRLFQMIVLLIVIIIIAFILSKFKQWSIFNQ